MRTEHWVREVVESFFSSCVGSGEIMLHSDMNTWVWETVDGASFTDLNDSSLIDLADEGLNYDGEWPMDFSTVREALHRLAHTALIHKVEEEINDAISSHNLDDSTALSDSPPEAEELAREYDGDTHIDEPLLVWGEGDDREVWKYIEDLGFWAEFTDSCPPSVLEEMKESVDEHAEAV